MWRLRELPLPQSCLRARLGLKGHLSSRGHYHPDQAGQALEKKLAQELVIRLGTSSITQQLLHPAQKLRWFVVPEFLHGDQCRKEPTKQHSIHNQWLCQICWRILLLEPLCKCNSSMDCGCARAADRVTSLSAKNLA